MVIFLWYDETYCECYICGYMYPYLYMTSFAQTAGYINITAYFKSPAVYTNITQCTLHDRLHKDKCLCTFSLS